MATTHGVRTGTTVSRSRSTWRDLPLELALVTIAFGVDLLVRNHTVGADAAARAHALDVLGLEQRLGLDWEHGVQHFAESVPGLTTLSSWFYVVGYLPVLVVALVWLFLRHRPAYLELRTAMLASGAVGMFAYAFYPTAPPRLTGLGYADPVAVGLLDHAARPTGVADELAAMPSFHVGWLLVVALVVAGVVESAAARWAVLSLPFLMTFAILATGNHWVLDVPPGVLLALGGLVFARWWTSRRPEAQITDDAHAGRSEAA